MKKHLGFIVYLIASIGLLWLVEDALEGWEYVAVVVAILAVYIVGMLEGARMQREVDEQYE